MILIKHSVKPSSIGGLGLFAAQKIEKDDIIWKNNTDSEWIITEMEKNKLSAYMQNVFEYHGYFDKIQLKWKLPLDNARYMNHSSTPNTYIDSEGNSRASFEIDIDQEMTCDYNLFDGSKRDFL